MSTVEAKTQFQFCLRISSALAALALVPVPVEAQDGEGVRETRVTVGPRLVPGFPGAEEMSLRPYVDVSRRRGDEPFPFRPPDESPSVVVYKRGDITFGPVIGFVGKRHRDDAGGLDEVASTIEAGAFIRYSLGSHVHLSAEARQGINGHKALTGVIRADYVARDGDRWLWSIGPRLTLASGRYAESYFGVTPREAAATGVPAWRADGGLLAAGAVVGARRQLSRRWGLFGYAKYDRLLGTAADSPVVDLFGSRDQWSGGVGVSYVFGRHRQ